MKKLTVPIKSLAGRFTLLLVLALIIANVVTLLVLGIARDRELRKIQRYGQIERLITLIPALNALAPELRNDVASAASNRRLRISLDERPIVKRASLDADAQVISGYIKDRLNFAGDNNIRVRMIERKPSQEDNQERKKRKKRKRMLGQITLISIPMPDGSWLNARQSKDLGPLNIPGRPILLALLLTFITVLAVGLWFIRRLTRPLRQLSSAANKAGRGDRTARIVETGATEIKDAARAFNAMQVDIEAFESERARTIAAVGHDLRTPITSLRIRTEMVEESDLREPMIQTLDDMQVMADDLLAWGRAEAIKEETKEIDLSVMLENVCNSTTITYEDSDPCFYKCRPVALLRALTNLVENTERYAGNGIAKLTIEDMNIIITVEDNGPGIPAEQLKTIFKPFTRGETSRSKETGGHGLGLSIAESIIRSHGGTVTLQNKTDTTGLVVTITLPN